MLNPQVTNNQPAKRGKFPLLRNADDSGANNWKQMVESKYKAATEEKLRKLSKAWGVRTENLDHLMVGYSKKLDAYTIPEFDGNRHVIGIALRYSNEGKSCVKGSQRGLTIPQNLDDLLGKIVIVEGASDTAALNSIGIASVGRPSAWAGFDLLVQLLGSMHERQVLVLGEFDPKNDGSWPGRDAAEALAKHLAIHLNREVQWGLPPKGCKDARDFIKLLTQSANQE